MSLDKHLEPDWVDDYDDIDDELDPDMDRDRRDAEATEDAYDRWVEAHSWPSNAEAWDEGYNAGKNDLRDGHTFRTVNPHRRSQ